MNIIELAQQAYDGLGPPLVPNTTATKFIERFATLVRAAALEEAADICERLGLSQNSEWEAGTLDCAAAIRQLKETK